MAEAGNSIDNLTLPSAATAETLWGPFVSDRQWGTVREDYSADGQPWTFTTHDMARSKAYRWGEEGIAGICDNKQILCFALALWNKKDSIIKERYFGLAGPEGNHGEDVKELYYYLDATPAHTYMKMLYKYPQAAFPYQRLVDENRRRTRLEPEFELIDTGIFDTDEYFDVFVEYAKASADDILVKITVHNRGRNDAALHIIPTIWFRNTWVWGYDNYKPKMTSSNKGEVLITHESLGSYQLHAKEKGTLLFCDNETNLQRLYGVDNGSAYTKDGINDYLVNGNKTAVNPNAEGTKAAIDYELVVKGGGSYSLKFRLQAGPARECFEDFDAIFAQRKKEADEFYAALQKGMASDEEKRVQRQAFAGMLWSKQFYYYDVDQWLRGDPAQVPPPTERQNGRNCEWKHLNNAAIISMPDKWEYPWYAAWDLAFHCIPLSMVDAAFAKKQLLLLTRAWYMHPNGQLPAYEWSFSDVNPPVHAWAALRVYQIDQAATGRGDVLFLETVFHKLLLNFTWWVNRKDAQGNNIFEGGFLGLDNIGVFDRSAALPTGGYLEQSDGTSWMAMYTLNMMRISLELALVNPAYEDLATKFFEHFLYIAGAMASKSGDGDGLWDEDDQFYYDVLHLPRDGNRKIKLRSMVGLIPLFAVEVLDHAVLEKLPGFRSRLDWFLDNRPDLAALVSRWQEKSDTEKHLLSLLRGHRMKKILERMLDETEFLSDHGVRALSKYHLNHPYEMWVDGTCFSVQYTPAESTTALFGGNSNWRGPVWMPVNYLVIESLQRFHYYYTDDFRVECPTGSGQLLSLNEIADELSRRLRRLFLADEQGHRPVFGDNKKLQTDPHFKDYLLFYEYFDGDNGRGVGASHQTGWTGLIAKLLQPRENPLKKRRKKSS
ncbi:MGH1-like glycoside hydrolase domain-containing protein [Flavisolibacter nicotianae]|uniref:MGH1-like glycoside hydrolase domain-containing protein n=1 Tax=Flavisolibacter nicotianae TaxID=2364882 RepID=UPI001F097077|nr:glucosidase [Flavisolibacter nicotianae]